jgi:hypothetical protein
MDVPSSTPEDAGSLKRGREGEGSGQGSRGAHDQTTGSENDMGTAAKKTRDDASGPPSPASASVQPPLGSEGPPSGGHGGSGASGSSDGQPRPRPQSQPQAPPSFERKPNGSGTDFSGWKCGKRYKLLRALGHGSYGLVALATDLETNEKVAIKKIPNVFQQHIDARRILRETYILRHLDHMNLIKLRDIPRPEDMETFTDLYLVFEYVLGSLAGVRGGGTQAGGSGGDRTPGGQGVPAPVTPVSLPVPVSRASLALALPLCLAALPTALLAPLLLPLPRLLFSPVPTIPCPLPPPLPFPRPGLYPGPYPPVPTVVFTPPPLPTPPCTWSVLRLVRGVVQYVKRGHTRAVRPFL